MDALCESYETRRGEASKHMMMEPSGFGERRHQKSTKKYVPTLFTFRFSWPTHTATQPNMTTGKLDPPQNNTAPAASEKKRTGSPLPAAATKKKEQVREIV